MLLIAANNLQKILKYPDLRSIPKRQRRGVDPNARVSVRSIHLFPSGAGLPRARAECMVFTAAFCFKQVFKPQMAPDRVVEARKIRTPGILRSANPTARSR